jgi:hypothetical protein
MNKDLMNLIPSRLAAERTFSVIDHIQQWKAHEQVVALAATFLLLCETQRINPREALATAERIITHAEGKLPEFTAIRQYLKEEINV